MENQIKSKPIDSLEQNENVDPFIDKKLSLEEFLENFNMKFALKSL